MSSTKTEAASLIPDSFRKGHIRKDMSMQSLVRDPYKHYLLPVIFSSRFSSDSKADASELLENRDEMFPLCYQHGDILADFNISNNC